MSDYSVNTSQNNAILADVALIRPLLVIMLVFYHAFLVVSGGWSFSDSYPEIKTYWWLDKISYAFLLETFVFVSGYVFGFQVRTKGVNKLDVKSILWGKFKRLIIPSMIFSLLYICLFRDISQPILKTIRSIVAGAGHMWFLPMLFWCFIGIWVIEKLHLKSVVVLPILVVSSIISFLPLPLQLGRTMYYMLFFYVGYTIQKDDIQLEKLYTWTICSSLVIAFAILFPLLTVLSQSVSKLLDSSEYQFDIRLFMLSAKNVLKLIYSSLGVMMLLVIVGTIEKTTSRPLPQWLINIGGYCMGVYIFQQFILIALYKHTGLPSIVGPYWLPWCGFIIALVGSLFLTYLFRLSKFGRFLLG